MTLYKTLVFGAAIGVLAGCGVIAPAKLETADDLAAALDRKGIDYDTSEPVDVSGFRFARIDEGVVLRGTDRRIDILRVEDERTFKIAKTANALLNFAEDKVGQEIPGKPVIFSRHPFIVIIRGEDETGPTARALESLLGAETTTE